MEFHHLLNTSSVAPNENMNADDKMEFTGIEALRITEMIDLYGEFVLVPLGVLFNLISLVIFCRHSMYRSAIGIHLKCIAVADTLVITTILISKLRDSDLINMDLSLCTINVFLMSVGVPWSGLLLSSATIERFVSIAFALKVKTWNLFRISKICNLVYFAFSVSFSAVGTKINGDFICGLVVEASVLAQYFNFIGNSILLFTFLGVTLTFTILIAIFLFLHSRRRRAMVQGHENQSNKEFQISLMLFIVAVPFTILRFPRLASFLIRYFYGSKRQFKNKLFINTVIAWPITNLLLVINHSINFVIYVTFLKSFRDQLRALMQCDKSTPRGNNSRYDQVQSVSSSIGK